MKKKEHHCRKDVGRGSSYYRQEGHWYSFWWYWNTILRLTWKLSGLFQIGHIDGDPSRKGAFPVSFVHFIVDWIATDKWGHFSFPVVTDISFVLFHFIYLSADTLPEHCPSPRYCSLLFLLPSFWFWDF